MAQINQVVGKGISVKGNDIDTDRIIPARFMRTITFDELGKYAFYDARFDENKKEKEHSFNNPKHQGASILIVNKNFGCGSSREHAPQSLIRWGIKAIVGESFAEIFAGNCQMLGVPCVIAKADDVTVLQDFAEGNPEAKINVNVFRKKVFFGDFSIDAELSNERRKSLIAGSWDTLGMLVNALDKTKEKVQKIPYLNEFK
ncbi:MAG: 3-isopropylmalate dehydratase small subunit [archaeon]|nr:3-isopropylmalate dehydratase small subunit [archaeon]